MQRYKATAHLDGGFDMEAVSLTFIAFGFDDATKAFEAAMTQLGFKRSDYGYIRIEWLADA